MSQPETPPLEVSAEKIASHLANLRIDLTNDPGLKVAGLPDELMSDLSTFLQNCEALVAASQAIKAGIDRLPAGLKPDLSGLITALPGAASTGLAAIASKLDSPLGEALWYTAYAVQGVAQVCFSIWQALEALKETIGYSNANSKACCKELSDLLKSGNVVVKCNMGDGWEAQVTRLVKAMKDFKGLDPLVWLGPAKAAPEPKGG